MAGIKLRQVTKKYGSLNVLNSIDLDVADGEFLTLVGPSGCGKSTTLRIIAGLETQTTGDVEIDGALVNEVRPSLRDLAMVFQSYALYPHLTVQQNLMTPLRLRDLDFWERLPLLGYLVPGRAGKMAKIKEEVHNVAAVLKIEPLLNRKPGQLSGGQRQRVALGRAMVRNPAAFLMDEPLSNLDASLRVHMRAELSELHRDLQSTFIYVTHDQEEALAVSDQIVVMRNAAIAQIGSPRDLYDAPASRFVADFIGEANLLPCMIDNISGAVAEVTIEGYRHRLDANGLSTGPATMAVRPSRLDVKATEGFKAKVVKSTYVGNRMEYTLVVQSGEIFAVHEDVDNTLAIGQEITLGFFEKGPVLLPAA